MMYKKFVNGHELVECKKTHAHGTGESTSDIGLILHIII